MITKKYFSVTSRGLKIITYRSENINGIIKEIIDDIIWSYGLEPDEITSETFDSDYFRELFDFDKNDAQVLKELVKFKESLKDTTIELDETSNYQFEDPEDKWSLNKFMEPQWYLDSTLWTNNTQLLIILKKFRKDFHAKILSKTHISEPKRTTFQRLVFYPR